ncbi:MAG: LamG domain-containing protein [Gammaproteobacteria bacterium]|nr:LamG domain-containing protein [Gammaproteobacteria bacterium]
MTTNYIMTNQISKLTGWNYIRLSLLAALSSIVLIGCGGGASTTEQVPQSSGGTSKLVSAPADGDMAKFRDNLWANITATNRCGNCHAPGKLAGSFPFANANDLSGSYATANQDKYVNRTSPGLSGIVKKVAGGHNCWTSNLHDCETSLTQWISAWVQASGNPGQSVSLTATPGVAVGGGKFFPSSYPPEYVAVHDLLKVYCSACHVPNVPQAQQPYFAVDGTPAATFIQSSYEAVVNNAKINLITPSESRLYRRLVDDHHNCWSDCATNGADMLAAITAMTNAISPTTQEPGTVVSRAVNLYTDGISASSGHRIEDAQIVLYDFKEGQNSVINDRGLTSALGPQVNLQLSGTEGVDYKWLPSWGITFITPTVRAAATDSSKVYNELVSSGAYTIEAWVIPANNVQQDANIVGYSANGTQRNFSLSQYNTRYRDFNRTGNPAVPLAQQLTGEPFLEANKLIASQQHVVVTYSANTGRRIYVDGVYTGDADTTSGYALDSWLNPGYSLVLGKEASNSTPWLGTLRKVAIHKRALSADEIQQNYAASVGQKYLLMFDVSAASGIPGSYIYMQAEEYDSFSYLFYKPTYINLSGNSATGLQIKGIRLGINGREASVGQAFAGVDATINTTDYIPGTGQDSGQVLSYVGTIIPKDKGATDDLFYLDFELIGNTAATKDYNPSFSTVPAAMQPVAVSDVMIRKFEEINATLADYTGIDPTTASIGGTTGTYTTVYQQLPPVESIDGFLASQQMAVTQLAIQYCSVLVDDTSKRAAYFPGVTFGGMSFSSDSAKDLVISPLLTRVINNGENLATQPTDTEVRTILRTLMTDLSTGCASSCSSTQTANIVKATCAAAMAGAPMLLQ